jgi:hypothetical protein
MKRVTENEAGSLFNLTVLILILSGCGADVYEVENYRYDESKEKLMIYV